jgi:hypothetical protein
MVWLTAFAKAAAITEGADAGEPGCDPGLVLRCEGVKG